MEFSPRNRRSQDKRKKVLKISGCHENGLGNKRISRSSPLEKGSMGVRLAEVTPKTAEWFAASMWTSRRSGSFNFKTSPDHQASPQKYSPDWK
jgi:hypothetical protein